MATIREAFEYAAKNPNSEFALNLQQLAASGSLDVEARKNGIDLTPFKPTPIVEPEQKKRIDEKILSFTGGDVIAKGLGQSLADTNINLPFARGESTSKLLNETQIAQGGQQQRLIEAIRKNKVEGKDTSVLEKALFDLTGQIAETGSEAEKLLNPNQITGKQLAGDVLQLSTTIAGAGSLPNAAKTVTKTPGIIKGGIEGIKTGAKVGGIYGGATGIAQGLKEDQDIEGILKQGLKGASVGGVTGGIVGGITGAVSGRIQQKRINKLTQEDNFVKDLVSPKETVAIKEKALAEGRVTEAGLLKKSQILPSKRDKQLAEVAKDYVSSKKPITENIDSVRYGIKQINEGVREYVKTNKVPFNTNQLKTQLNKGKDDLNLIFASDTQAEKTYNAVVEEFMRGVNSKDTMGLLDRRQGFDKIPAIKKLLDSQGLGENTKKEVVLTVRDMANKYIANLLPKGNQYRNQLLTESKLIEALGNMVEKNAKMIGQNKLQMLTKEYPFLKGIAGALATGLGLGAVGVGASVINSSD